MLKYRSIGMKLTPQRLAILDYLKGNTSHPSAEDIYSAVRDRFPTMSLATVYNTLAALQVRSVVQELTIDPHKRRYDPNVEQHNHLICTRCSKIVDVHLDFALDLPEEIKQSFSVTGNHVEFYGVCSACRNTTADTKL